MECHPNVLFIMMSSTCCFCLDLWQIHWKRVHTPAAFRQRGERWRVGSREVFCFKHVLIKVGSFNHRMTCFREKRRGTEAELGEKEKPPREVFWLLLNFSPTASVACGAPLLLFFASVMSRCQMWFFFNLRINSCSLRVGPIAMWATCIASTKTERKTENPPEYGCQGQWTRGTYTAYPLLTLTGTANSYWL